MLDLGQLLLLGLVAAGGYLVYFKTARHDPREPPLVQPSIPVVGHLIGLGREGTYYVTKLRYSPNAPSFPRRPEGESN